LQFAYYIKIIIRILTCFVERITVVKGFIG
jgi:hypothetical protein